MKIVARITSLIALLAAAIVYSGCGGGGGGETSATDTQNALLNGTWKATSVTLDGDDPGVSYSAFTLTISAPAGSTTPTYTASGRPDLSPWPASGNFSYGSSVASQLIRSDDVEISYSVTSTTLTMDFDFDGAGYAGRTKNVVGSWHFVFTKQ